MIKAIGAIGRYLRVNGGQSSSTYINSYSGAQGVGNVRYNTTTQNLEVYDGNNWILLGMGFADVGLTGEAESLLDWAREERDRRNNLEEMAKNNVTVADALKRVRDAEDQLQVVAVLCKQEEKSV